MTTVAGEYAESLGLATSAVLQNQPGPLGMAKIYLSLIHAMQDALDIEKSDRRRLPPAAPQAP